MAGNVADLKKKPSDGPSMQSPANNPTIPAPNGKDEGKQKPTESKAAKFVRLANRRVGKAIRVISHIANLGNQRQYEGTVDQKVKIVQALEKALMLVKTSFAGNATKDAGFSL